jgi:hypothetical protein
VGRGRYGVPEWRRGRRAHVGEISSDLAWPPRRSAYLDHRPPTRTHPSAGGSCSACRGSRSLPATNQQGLEPRPSSRSDMIPPEGSFGFVGTLLNHLRNVGRNPLGTPREGPSRRVLTSGAARSLVRRRLLALRATAGATYRYECGEAAAYAYERCTNVDRSLSFSVGDCLARRRARPKLWGEDFPRKARIRPSALLRLRRASSRSTPA